MTKMYSHAISLPTIIVLPPGMYAFHALWGWQNSNDAVEDLVAP